MLETPAYLITKLEVSDCCSPISIQVLDELGNVCGKVGYISPEDFHLCVEGKVIPETVISAAKKLSTGDLVWLDSRGNAVNPF